MIWQAEVVEWIDSQGDGSWHPLFEAKAEEVSRITTVGYVIGETDEAVTLAQSIDGKGGNERRIAMVDNTITIPKVAITKRTPIDGVTFSDG